MNPADITRLRGIVAAEILEAAEVASRALREAGVPHALAGGLAVGAYGYPRTTDLAVSAYERGEIGDGELAGNIAVATLTSREVECGKSLGTPGRRRLNRLQQQTRSPFVIDER